MWTALPERRPLILRGGALCVRAYVRTCVRACVRRAVRERRDVSHEEHARGPCDPPRKRRPRKQWRGGAHTRPTPVACSPLRSAQSPRPA